MPHLDCISEGEEGEHWLHQAAIALSRHRDNALAQASFCRTICALLEKKPMLADKVGEESNQ